VSSSATACDDAVNKLPLDFENILGAIMMSPRYINHLIATFEQDLSAAAGTCLTISAALQESAELLKSIHIETWVKNIVDHPVAIEQGLVNITEDLKDKNIQKFSVDLAALLKIISANQTESEMNLFSFDGCKTSLNKLPTDVENLIGAYLMSPRDFNRLIQVLQQDVSDAVKNCATLAPLLSTINGQLQSLNQSTLVKNLIRSIGSIKSDASAFAAEISRNNLATAAEHLSALMRSLTQN